MKIFLTFTVLGIIIELCQGIVTLNIFYCSKRQKDKTQVKQLRQSSPITYISKYTIEHNNI